MNLLLALVLGLVQGLTEFIPVSSSGHLEIVQQLLGERGADFHYFLELINFGTLLALLFYYLPRLRKILRDIFKKHNFRLVLNIIITCIPAGLAGLLLSDLIEESPFFSSLITIAMALGMVGILMVIIDKLPRASALKDENHLTPMRALAIGVAQMTALIPGVSRSGSTIIAGRLAGLKAAAAADYSFLVSIPLLGAVCLKTLLSGGARAYLAANLLALILANLVAFLAGLLAIAVVLKYLRRRRSLRAFGWYRIILSLVILTAVLISTF